MCPIQNSGAKCAGLRHESQIAHIGPAVVKGGIQADGWTHNTQTIGPEQAYAVMASVFQNGTFQRQSGCACFGKASSNNYDSLDPVLATVFNNVRNSLWWGGNDRQLHSLADLGKGGVGLMALHDVSRGIDGEQGAFVATLQHVAKHNLANSIDAVACAKYGH